MKSAAAFIRFLQDAKERWSTASGPLLIALDGPCASGKTTLAGWLQTEFGWSVVHMDHFFLQPHQRTPERYATPGENVDHERLLEEVLRPLLAGEAAEYRPFDCHTQSFSGPVRIAPGRVTLVEGAYSCHPSLWDLYDLRVFLKVNEITQLRRLEGRVGPQRLAEFQERWMPLEQAYFSAFDIEARCDHCLEL